LDLSVGDVVTLTNFEVQELVNVTRFSSLFGVLP
jgi:hypothetical protein